MNNDVNTLLNDISDMTLAISRRIKSNNNDSDDNDLVTALQEVKSALKKARNVLIFSAQ